MPDRQRKETLAADGRAGTDLPEERLGNYRPRVLLVDDQPENLVALRAVAETLDVDAVCAESGMAALRELLHSDFAIIVLDVQMPELDGFETAQLIKSRERSRNVPILFLTAIHREERYALRAYGLGAADYVTKPVDAEVLRAKLKAFVDLDRARAQISSQAERLREVERVAFRRRADARFRALAETLPIVLFTADRNGNVTYGNERFRGAHRDDDGDVSAIASPEDQDALRAGFAIALSSKIPFVTDVRLRIPRASDEPGFRDADVEVRWHQLQIAWIPSDEETEHEGMFVGSALDVDDRRKAEQVVATQRAWLEGEARGTDQFLAVLSHELRTPLNAMIGWTKLLRDGALDPAKAKRAIAIVERNARAQAQLVSDLLDVSRIKSGKLHLDRTVVDLAEVALAVVDDFRPGAGARDVRLRFIRSGEAEPVRVDGDRGRLAQVVTNLVGNAIKFAKKGGLVVVSCSLHGDRALVSVKDDGPGIAPEFLPNLFDAFRQADGSTTRATGGLGLGLSIVKSLVSLHGGDVTVSSRPGAGSVFEVSLPRAASAAETREKLSTTQDLLDAETLVGRLILVVDDDPDGCALTTLLLARHGAEVVSFDSVDAALRAVTAMEREGSHFDAVVTDLAMPGRDGFALLAELRARPETKRLPIIALTAFAAEEDRRRCLEAGFETHIPKPVDASTLVLALGDALDRRRR
jgi:hypothetical protein